MSVTHAPHWRWIAALSGGLACAVWLRIALLLATRPHSVAAFSTATWQLAVTATVGAVIVAFLHARGRHAGPRAGLAALVLLAAALASHHVVYAVSFNALLPGTWVR